MGLIALNVNIGMGILLLLYPLYYNENLEFNNF